MLFSASTGTWISRHVTCVCLKERSVVGVWRGEGRRDVQQHYFFIPSFVTDPTRSGGHKSRPRPSLFASTVACPMARLLVVIAAFLACSASAFTCSSTSIVQRACSPSSSASAGSAVVAAG